MNDAIRFTVIDHRDLIRMQGRPEDLRGGARLASFQELMQPLPEGDLMLGWLESGGKNDSSPNFIVGSERDLADLLPRMLALPGASIPVTSGVRAWYSEDVRSMSMLASFSMSPQTQLGFIGLVMFEIASAHEAAPDLRLVGMEQVRRTLSFVCARATIWGWRDASLTKVTERWIEASSLTGNPIHSHRAIGLTKLYEFLQTLSGIEHEGTHEARNLAERIQMWIQRDATRQMDLLTTSTLSAVDDLANLRGRERRFDFVMKTLGGLLSSGVDDPLLSGFLISLIEPGSFDFEGLTRRFDDDARLVSAAYFAFASILGGSASLKRHSGFGSSVVNHGFLERTDAHPDLSFAELRVLHSMRRPTPLVYRTRSPFSVDVELIPMVTGSFRNTSRRTASVVKKDELAVYVRKEELLRARLQSAVKALEDAYEVLESGDARRDGKEPPTRRKQKG